MIKLTEQLPNLKPKVNEEISWSNHRDILDKFYEVLDAMDTMMDSPLSNTYDKRTEKLEKAVGDVVIGKGDKSAAYKKIQTEVDNLVKVYTADVNKKLAKVLNSLNSEATKIKAKAKP